MASHSIAALPSVVPPTVEQAGPHKYLLVRTAGTHAGSFRESFSGFADRTLGAIAYALTSLLCILFELGSASTYTSSLNSHSSSPKLLSREPEGAAH